MWHKMKVEVSKFCADLSGATAIEYGMIATGIAIVIIGGIALLGDQLAAFFDTLATALEL
jgi:pilus assembly protein Flp/PilA